MVKDTITIATKVDADSDLGQWWLGLPAGGRSEILRDVIIAGLRSYGGDDGNDTPPPPPIDPSDLVAILTDALTAWLPSLGDVIGASVGEALSKQLKNMTVPMRFSENEATPEPTQAEIDEAEKQRILADMEAGLAGWGQ